MPDAGVHAVVFSFQFLVGSFLSSIRGRFGKPISHLPNSSWPQHSCRNSWLANQYAQNPLHGRVPYASEESLKEPG